MAATMEIVQGITPASGPTIILLRQQIRQEYPEIDDIYTDVYLATVLSQSSSEGRINNNCSSCSSSLENNGNDDNSSSIGIATKKIRESLQWRRNVNVDLLTSAFAIGNDYDTDGVFHPTTATATTGDDNSIPPTTTTELMIDICQSGAFRFVGFNNKGKAILHARAALLNWRNINIDDGIKYHILVIEHALKAMLMRNNNNDVTKNEKRMASSSPANNNDIGNVSSSESIILYIDTSNMGLLPPPLAALTGLAMLMQTAYPYRFERAYVGPVNILLRGLNKAVSVFLTAGSRQKITMMKNVPSNETVGELLSDGNGQSTP
jgi:hypothetical protein